MLRAEMRRKERRIEQRQELDQILEQGELLYLALAREDEPYLVPLNYGYDGQNIYFHGSGQGLKMELLRRNPKVCFSVAVDMRIKQADKPCLWGVAGRSVVGFGRAIILEDPQEKIYALNHIMSHYGGTNDAYGEKILDKTTVVRIQIESLTGKDFSRE